MKIFYSLEELKPYYNEKTNTYEFVENVRRFDVRFEFRLDVEANITARDINARNINARNINAGYINASDIKAWDINAGDINAGDINARCINAYDIIAYDIKAYDIKAHDIKADNVEVENIEARNISYYALCYAFGDIKCRSISGRRENAKHFVFDGKIVIVSEEQEVEKASEV